MSLAPRSVSTAQDRLPAHPSGQYSRGHAPHPASPPPWPGTCPDGAGPSGTFFFSLMSYRASVPKMGSISISNLAPERRRAHQGPSAGSNSPTVTPHPQPHTPRHSGGSVAQAAASQDTWVPFPARGEQGLVVRAGRGRGTGFLGSIPASATTHWAAMAKPHPQFPLQHRYHCPHMPPSGPRDEQGSAWTSKAEPFALTASPSSHSAGGARGPHPTRRPLLPLLDRPSLQGSLLGSGRLLPAAGMETLLSPSPREPPQPLAPSL